jgi:hypothetical protein
MSDAAPEQTSSDENTGQSAQNEDDVKRKFREALERKRNPYGDAHGGGAGKNSSKVRGVHGPASNQKSFRRKSG